MSAFPEPVWGVLTRAADRLAEVSAHWVDFERGFAEQEPMPDGTRRWDSPLDMWMYDTVDRNGARAPREWVAALSPVVAAPLIEWLRQTARAAEAEQPKMSDAWLRPEDRWDAPLRLARGVLGEEQP